jgi:hypothetical protein
VGVWLNVTHRLRQLSVVRSRPSTASSLGSCYGNGFVCGVTERQEHLPCASWCPHRRTHSRSNYQGCLRCLAWSGQRLIGEDDALH